MRKFLTLSSFHKPDSEILSINPDMILYIKSMERETFLTSSAHTEIHMGNGDVFVIPEPYGKVAGAIGITVASSFSLEKVQVPASLQATMPASDGTSR